MAGSAQRLVRREARVQLSDRPLPRSFFARSSLEVAPDLLGRDVRAVSEAGVVRARLVEVEAYQGSADPGSHAFRGETPRNCVMFGPPGHLYVYFTYGIHWCANVVCGQDGIAEAILLRAAVILQGRDIVASRRPRSTTRDLARGPARLAKALALDGSDNGADIVRGGLQFLPGEPAPATTIRTGPRVGVAGAGALTPWRYWIDGVPEVSTYRPAVVRGPRKQA